MREAIFSVSITTGNGRLGNQTIQALHLAANYKWSILDISEKDGADIVKKNLRDIGHEWNIIYIKYLNKLSFIYGLVHLGMKVIRFVKLPCASVSINASGFATEVNRQTDSTSITRRQVGQQSQFLRNKAIHFLHKPMLSAEFNNSTIELISAIKHYQAYRSPQDVERTVCHVRIGDFQSVDGGMLLYNDEELRQLKHIAQSSKNKPILLSDNMESTLIESVVDMYTIPVRSSQIEDWNQMLLASSIFTNLSTFAISAFLVGQATEIHIPTRLVKMKRIKEDPLFAMLCSHVNPNANLFTTFEFKPND